MFTTLFNTLPVLLTLITGFGVMVHDTKIDRATVTALTASAAIASSHGALNAIPDMRGGEHIHTESVRLAHVHKLSVPDPRLQTRDSDIKKYINSKKLPFNTSPV